MCYIKEDHKTSRYFLLLDPEFAAGAVVPQMVQAI